MEYIFFNMIPRILFGFLFLTVLHCHPYPERLNLPDLDISSPQEVNSLEQDDSFQVKNYTNMEETVKEVEEIIKSNPALPRLTRGEIFDLLENITNLDKQKAKILPTARDPKAIMVVMPYTPTNDKNMEDLYTKAPITRIIGAEPFKTKEEVSKIKSNSRRRPPVKFNEDIPKKNITEKKPPVKFEDDISEKTTIPEKVENYDFEAVKTKPTRSRNQIRRRRPTATTTTSTTTEPPKRALPTTYHPRTRRPVRRRTTTTAAPIQYLDHQYPEEFVPNQGIRIVDSPKFVDLDFQADTRHEITVKPDPVSAALVTPSPLTEDINVPDNLKTVMKDMNVDTALNPQKTDEVKGQLEDRLKTTIEEHNRIRNMLASMGILPETTSTTTALPNAENVAESLSPDMRDLLMSFGLLANPNQKPEEPQPNTYYPEKADVKPESYVGFKPLPDDGPGRDGMDALLASFGLGRSARKEKAVKQDKEKYNLDVIPDYLQAVASDLGITQLQNNRDEKKIRTSSTKQHVFNPDTQYATDAELKKLEKLMGVIKQLEKLNGTVTDDDLKKIDMEGLKELVTSFNDANNHTLLTLEDDEKIPDPNKFDFGLAKNEVKRQESTTEEAATPSLTELEASFGGQTEAPTEPPVEETTRRTGFYYLVDWNTFLDIDDAKGKRVNLRFQPTVGDPKRFLSVNVP